MPLHYHPAIGTVVICDYKGFVPPEMVKRRPAIVVSPNFKYRDDLCSVVPLSTTEPDVIMPYHCKLEWSNPLPPPYNSPFHWVKADMFATVSFSRLSLPHNGKDRYGKRQYITRTVSAADLKIIRQCILNAIDLSYLTTHL